MGEDRVFRDAWNNRLDGLLVRRLLWANTQTSSQKARQLYRAKPDIVQRLRDIDVSSITTDQ